MVAPANRVDSAKFQYLFNLLYTVYSIPNIILPFFGGYFTDKLGARLMNVVFCTCLLIGQIVLTAGVFMGSFPVMLLGRVFFGFGGESLCVSAQAMLTQWFSDSLKPSVVHPDSVIKKLGLGIAFAMGLNLSISRLGSVFNNIISPLVAQFAADRHHGADDSSGASGSGADSSAATMAPGVPYAFAFGCVVMSGALLSSIAAFCLDKAAENAGKKAGFGPQAGGREEKARLMDADALSPSVNASEEASEDETVRRRAPLPRCPNAAARTCAAAVLGTAALPSSAS